MTQLRSGRIEESGTATAVPASTVVLVRPTVGDGGSGAEAASEFEVFLQERTIKSDFAGGAYVFPGGKLDPADRDMPDETLGPVDVPALQAALATATPREAVALVVAGVREAFEEAGVLFAHRQGRPVTATDLAEPEFRAMRVALADRATATDWRPFLLANDLVLDLRALVPLAWWITPHGLHRRYSAHFFVAPAPQDQIATLGHDGAEMTDSVWLSPKAALAAGESGRRTIIYPTRRTLAALSAHADMAAVMAAARAGQVDLRPIVPLLRSTSRGTGVQHPDGGPIEDV